MNKKTETGILTINLSALAQNYQYLQSKTGANCKIAGIVKANAYGLGLEPVIMALLKQKCPQFFVATLNEAIKFRSIEKEAPVAVLGGLFPNAEDIYIKNNIQPVINSLDDLARWNRIAETQINKLPTILHFDTAMNRLGLSEEDARTLISNPDLYSHLNIDWVMTHFACADEENHDLTQKQTQKFSEIANHFPMAKRSLGNSSGVFRDVQYHTDMVRPGIALYGGNPTPEKQNPMYPVISLNAKVLQTRLCKKGDSIGYGASQVFKEDTYTATVAIGYADGFLRSNSNKGQLYFQNDPCPILGRVSMDLTTIDISNCPEKPRQGDWVEILGPNQSIDDLATHAGTISYEVLTSLGSRYAREYIE